MGDFIGGGGGVAGGEGGGGMIRKYHNHKPQTIPWHREKEPQSLNIKE